MSTLARDLDDFGAKPPETSDAYWELFQTHRRAERSQIDVDENKIGRAERTQGISKALEKSRGE